MNSGQSYLDLMGGHLVGSDMVSASTRKRRQQGGDDTMFQAAIINDEFVGSFKVGNGPKINSETYCAF